MLGSRWTRTRCTSRSALGTCASPRADVDDVTETGGYWLPKVAGPPHLSLADRGVTFATNRQQGLCITLTRPHKGIDPIGLFKHPGVTVTVDDLDGLAHALRRGR